MSGNRPQLDEELKKLETLKNALEHLETSLAPILAVPREKLRESLESKVDRAKLDVATAYSISSLFYVLLKSNGKFTADHGVMTELKRVAESFKRVKAAARVEAGEETEPEPADKPTVRVNAEAGKRIVAHTLATNASLVEQPVPFGGVKRGAEEGGPSSQQRKSSPGKRREGIVKPESSKKSKKQKQRFD